MNLLFLFNELGTKRITATMSCSILEEIAVYCSPAIGDERKKKSNKGMVHAHIMEQMAYLSSSLEGIWQKSEIIILYIILLKMIDDPMLQHTHTPKLFHFGIE
jgi:hypothetical protein